MRHRGNDRVQHEIKTFADIFSEEAQDKIAMLLKQRIFTAVAPIRFGVRKVLCPVQLDYQVLGGKKQVHFHLSCTIKRNWQ